MGIVGFAVAAGFSLAPMPAFAKEIKVLASFLPLYCFAANVAADAAHADGLLPPNTSPHDFQLTVKTRKSIEAADLVILNGLGLDSWVEPALAKDKQRLVRVSSGLSNELIRSSGAINPHIWLDPILAIHCVTNIVQALVALDPSESEAYRRNAADYIARLQALDQELQDGLLPFKDQPIVTFHDSFSYFARRYGLRVVGVIEEVPDVSPSPRTLARLYAKIRETKPKCIFTEPQFPSGLAKTISHDLHVPVAALNTLESGSFTPDAYERGMRQNLRTLQEKLK